MLRRSSTRSALRLALAVSCCFVASGAQGENWPMWRGPQGDGTSRETDVPTRWSVARDENIAWKVELPGEGHASPIVWGDRVFVVACDPKTQERLLLCYARGSGELLWRRTVLQAPLELKHLLNSFASSTPATDGERIYVTFLEAQGENVPDPSHQAGKLFSPGQMVVAAYSLDGELLWKVRAGDFSSVHGFCSSPVLFEDKLIVNGDHDGDAYLVALDRATGKTRWKTDRENKTRSYSTPIIREIDGRTQMILSGSKSVASYDPHDGSRHWIINGPTEQFVASVVYDGRYLFVTGGFPDKHMLAIRPDGRGNVSDTHIAWRTTRGASYVPSPVAAGGYFLVAADNGVASCFDAQSGASQWVERLGGNHSGSPILANGRVYFTSDAGMTKVIEPGANFTVVAENDLEEPCFSSPAVSQGQIFFRGAKHLICVGESAAK